MSNPPKVFHSKVAGVTYDNPDGTGRQDLIRQCRAGDRLRSRREPDNRYDPNAVAVCTESGVRIGYLSSRLAAELAPLLDRGGRVDVEISEITGGGDERALGVNILMTVYGPDDAGRPSDDPESGSGWWRRVFGKD